MGLEQKWDFRMEWPVLVLYSWKKTMGCQRSYFTNIHQHMFLPVKPWWKHDVRLVAWSLHVGIHSDGEHHFLDQDAPKWWMMIQWFGIYLHFRFFYPYAKMFQVMVFLGFRWVPGVSVGSNLQEAIISSPPKPSFATVVSWGPVDPKYQYGWLESSIKSLQFHQVSNDTFEILGDDWEISWWVHSVYA